MENDFSRRLLARELGGAPLRTAPMDQEQRDMYDHLMANGDSMEQDYARLRFEQGVPLYKVNRLMRFQESWDDYLARANEIARERQGTIVVGSGLLVDDPFIVAQVRAARESEQKRRKIAQEQKDEYDERRKQVALKFFNF